MGNKWKRCRSRGCGLESRRQWREACWSCSPCLLLRSCWVLGRRYVLWRGKLPAWLLLEDLQFVSIEVRKVSRLWDIQNIFIHESIIFSNILAKISEDSSQPLTWRCSLNLCGGDLAKNTWKIWYLRTWRPQLQPRAYNWLYRYQISVSCRDSDQFGSGDAFDAGRSPKQEIWKLEQGLNRVVRETSAKGAFDCGLQNFFKVEKYKYNLSALAEV